MHNAMRVREGTVTTDFSVSCFSASMGVDFPMIPRESALFSSVCKPTSLEIVSSQVTAKASARPTLWCVPWFVPLQGIAGGDDMVKTIDFYALSWGVPVLH